MTELTFLLELFLESECPDGMRTKIIARIKQVELSMMQMSLGLQAQTMQIPQATRAQAPSLVPAPVAPEHVAQTPAAAMAIAQRDQIMAGKLDRYGKPTK